MKTKGFFCRTLCSIIALLLIISPITANAAENDLSLSQGCRTIDGQVPVINPVPELAEASAALLYDVTSDTLLYAENPDQPLYPAGLVKIMTALIVAERGNMDDSVTIRQDVLDTVSSGSRNMDLQAGEVISMQSLLYCILVEAANEAASIAADHISGSQSAFVEQMNAYAAELGCTNTNFVNVHGLHDDLQLTTARDMAKILSAATQNELFTEVFSTYSHKIPATNLSEARTLSSGSFIFNRNLGSNHYDSRVTGSRTGTTADGLRNLAITAKSNDHELISIVLGSISEINPDGSTGFYKEARILLDKGFNEFKPVQILHDNQVITQFEIDNGDSDVTVCAKANAMTSLPVDAVNSDLTYRYTKPSAGITAPLKAGDELATLQIWYKDVCLAQTPLYALHDVDVKEIVATQELTEETEIQPKTILTVVGVIVGLLLLLLFGRRLVFRFVRKLQIRRHKKNRRRRR